MAKRRINTGDDTPIQLNLTSMIDVVFLLLIFFMVTLKFKKLEQKVLAYLPKDRGLAKTLIKLEEKPKITVELKRTRGEKITRVKLLGAEIGSDSKGFLELDRRIQQIVNKSDELLPGEINAWAEVPHGDVIRTIDSFMKAGVEEITFVGAPEKGKAQSGPGDPNAR